MVRSAPRRSSLTFRLLSLAFARFASRHCLVLFHLLSLALTCSTSRHCSVLCHLHSLALTSLPVHSYSLPLSFTFCFSWTLSWKLNINSAIVCWHNNRNEFPFSKWKTFVFGNPYKRLCLSTWFLIFMLFPARKTRALQKRKREFPPRKDGIFELPSLSPRVFTDARTLTVKPNDLIKS